MDFRDVGIRAAKTFAQSFLAVLVAAGTGYLSIPTVKGALVAGGAAVISFLHNALLSVKE